MKNPRRWLEGVAIGGGLSAAAIGLLAFAHAQAHLSNGARCFVGFAHAQWPKWFGCAMAAHENLAGGLIGFAGVIFAAWLAYSGAQDQLAQVRKTAEEATRLNAQERSQEAASEVQTLRLAEDYLRNFASKFTDEGHPYYHNANFVRTLCDLHETARLYLSQSAANAPRGFGRRITTVMWRLEKLAERIRELKAQGALGDDTRSLMESEIRLAVAEVRKIAADIKQVMPELRERATILRERYIKLGGNPYID
jgi:hypothetical protein